MSVLTAAVQLAWPAVIGVRRAGIDVTELLEPLDLSWDDVRDPVRRLPYAVLCRLWDRAAELTQDPGFGLGVVGAAPTGSMGVLDYLLQNTASIGEKIAYYGRFQRLYQDATEVQLTFEHGAALMWYRVAPGVPISHVLTDFAFGCCIDQARQLSRKPHLVPREVWFRRPTPSDLRAHEDFFRCPLRFGMTRSAILFDTVWLSKSFGNDPLVQGVMEDQVSRLMDTLPPRSEFLRRAGEVVRAALAQGSCPTIEGVAAQLGMSARTFRRRLAEDDTGFRQVLDRQRCELALRYLEDPEIGTAEAAERLGFADPKSFSKAFRRWTGMSPRAYRARTAPI